jgi:hypothetical protein
MAELYSFLLMPLTGLNYNNLSFHNGLTLDHSASSQPILSNTIANSFLLGLTLDCSSSLFYQVHLSQGYPTIVLIVFTFFFSALQGLFSQHSTGNSFTMFFS